MKLRLSALSDVDPLSVPLPHGTEVIAAPPRRPESGGHRQLRRVAAARLLGLSPPTLVADRMEVVEGVELDYTSNELGADARELIEAKKRGERFELTAGERDRWLAESQRALALLEPADAESVLPREPPNRDELEAWLLEVRRSSWSQAGSG